MNRFLAPALIATTLAAPAFAQTSQEERDVGFIQGLIEDNLSTVSRTVLIEGFEGALSSQATIASLSILDEDGVWFRAEGLVLDWNRSALLGGRIEVTEMSAELIEFVRPAIAEPEAPDPEATPFSFALPDLPVSVEIDQIRADRIVLGEPLLGTEYAFSVDGTVALDGGEGSAQIIADRLDGTAGSFEISGAYSNSTEILALTMDLREEAGGIVAKALDLPGDPSVRLTLAGEGPISEYDADLTIATNDIERISGTFGFRSPEDGGQEIRLDIDGDVTSLIETDAYDEFFGDSVSLTLQGARAPDGALDLSVLEIETQLLSLTGTAALDPDGWPQLLELDGRVGAADGAPVVLPVAGGQTTVTEAILDITFDAQAGDRWTALFDVADFRQPDLTIPKLQLDGSGQLQRAVGDIPSVISGEMAYAARGLAFSDPALNEAVGADITGEIDFSQTGADPFEITKLTLTGPGLELAAEIGMDFSETLVVDTSVLLEASDLARFGQFSGLDLNGGAELVIVGDILPLDGMFDLSFFGSTQDLGVGIAQLDPLMAGTGQLVLEAERDTQGTRIENFEITTDELSATGQADITSRGSDADFDLTIRELGVVSPDLNGPATLIGTADVASDGGADIDVRATIPNGLATINATIDGEQVSFEAVTDLRNLEQYADLAQRALSGAVELNLSGTARTDASLFDITIDGTSTDLGLGIAQLDPLLRDDGTLSGRVTRTASQSFQIDGLELQTSGIDLSADGTFIDGDGAASFDLRLPQIAPVLPGLSGPVTLAGDVARDRDGILDADVVASGPGGAAVELDATIDTADPAFPANGTLTAQVQQLAPYSTLASTPLAGSVSTTISGEITSLTDAPTAPFAADIQLNGSNLEAAGRRLAGALAIDGQASRDDAGTLAFDADITAPGSAVVAADGTLDAQGLFIGGIDATIASLQPYSGLAGFSLSGGLDAALQGQAQTDGSEFDIALDISGTDISARGTALAGDLTLAGTAARSVDAGTRLDINGTGPGGAVIDALVEGQDQLNASISLAVDTIGSYAGLIGQPLSGGLDAQIDGTVAATLDAFDLLVDAQTSNLNPGNASVAGVLRGTGTIDGRFQQSPDGSLAINDLSVRYPNLTVTADLASRDGGGGGTFDARLADIGLFTSDLSGPATARGSAQLLPDGGYQLNVDATGPGGTTARIDGGISAGFAALNLGVSGQAPLGLANAFIEPRRINGTANFDLRVDGPPALSSVSGVVRLADGRLAAPSLSQALENIGGSIRLNGSSAQLDIAGRLSDGGQISVAGPIGLTGSQDAGLRILARDLVLRDPTLYETTANASLTITGPLAGGAQIAGEINIGPAEIQVPSSTVSPLGSLPQVTHIGAPTNVRRTLDRAGLSISGVEVASGGGGGPVYGLDITINAPARIFIRGRGLDAELGGSLVIGGTTAQVVPVGEFSLIRGRIDILQQRFELDEGGAFLQGDFDPSIRLVATTEADDGTIVQIIVDGPATEPQVRFQSTPDLPQDEVLARLIFGRDLASISPFQAVQLAAAVSTLAGGSSGGLIDGFRQGTGLDDFDITTDDEGNAAVRAGAYLSENVYTDVTVGSESTDININLDLTDDITVTGSAGSDGDTSIGIFFERDY